MAEGIFRAWAWVCILLTVCFIYLPRALAQEGAVEGPKYFEFPEPSLSEPPLSDLLERIKEGELGDTRWAVDDWRNARLRFSEAYAKVFAEQYERSRGLLPGGFPYREVYAEFKKLLDRIRVRPWPERDFYKIEFLLKKKVVEMERPLPELLLGRYYPVPMIPREAIDFSRYPGYSTKLEVTKKMLKDYLAYYSAEYAKEFEASRDFPSGAFVYADILKNWQAVVEKIDDSSRYQAPVGFAPFLIKDLEKRGREIDEMGWPLIETAIKERLSLARGQVQPGVGSDALVDINKRLDDLDSRLVSGDVNDGSDQAKLDSFEVYGLAAYQKKIWFFSALAALLSLVGIGFGFTRGK